MRQTTRQDITTGIMRVIWYVAGAAFIGEVAVMLIHVSGGLR